MVACVLTNFTCLKRCIIPNGLIDNEISTQIQKARVGLVDLRRL